MGRINCWNPFERIAGTKALILGLVGIILASGLGSLGNIHFDGIMDIHIGKDTSFWIYLLEALISWICISFFITIASFILSPSKFRIIDIWGTQAFSRILLIPIALYTIFFSQKEVSDSIMKTINNPEALLSIEIGQWVSFSIFILLSITTIIWMIIWMFNAYKVSSNLNGTKAIVSFIITVILSEILSKTIIHLLLT